MESILSTGAIEKIVNGEVRTEKEMMPVLQVTQLKLVQTQQQVSSKERFRMLLSDGINSQQGMLGTHYNQLVKDGILQTGSIVRLTQFVTQFVQNRILVVVVQLEVIETNSDIIRHPGKTDDQRGVDSGNKSNTTGYEQQQGKVDNTETVKSHAAVSPQVGQQRQVFGTASGFPGSAVPSPQGYSNPSASHGVPRQENARDHSTTYPGSAAPSPQAYSNPSASHGVPRQDNARDHPTTYPGSAPSPRVYSNPSAGNGVPRRDPPKTYPRQPAYQPPPPMYGNRGPVARNDAPPRIIPINALSPYSGRWTIKARVTSKAELKHYSNQRGEGKVFSFDLLDADGGEIRVTCFNAVADQFFDQIVVGNVYLVSRGSLKPAQKNFNHLKNDYEITLDNASTIQQCYEEDPAIPRHQFHFRSIGDIESLEGNSIIDVIGIVSSVSQTGIIMRKNGTETQKRAVQLKDMSGRSVEVTMWGNFCNAEGEKLQNLCDTGKFPVLAVKAGRISEFNGKAVSTIGSSQLFIDPDFVEAKKVKEWFDREGKNVPCISLSREFSGNSRVDVRKTISQIQDEKLGTSEKPDWITVSATIIYMKFDNFCYTACPIMNGDRPCSKKVTDNGDGTWRCEKCDKCVDECDYRYILQFQLQDHTGNTWVTAFQEAGEEIMGMPAKDLYYIKYEHNDDEKFDDMIRKVAFSKYIFKLKVKEETFSDEQRVKSTVMKVEKVNYSSDTRTILEAMEKLRTAGDAGSLPGVKQEDHLSVERSEFGNQFSSSGSRPLGGGGSSVMNEPQEQYNGGSYRGGPGGHGGGLPRQHIGSY